MYSIQKIRQRLLALACLGVVMPAIAADDLLEEIVVTADYRERTLAELPLSISVIDGDFSLVMNLRTFRTPYTYVRVTPGKLASLWI